MNGRPLHAGNVIRRDFLKVLERAKLPRIRFHDLRHSAATQYINRGADLRTVSAFLGHGSPAFTLSTYAHVVPGKMRALSQAIEDASPEVLSTSS